MSISNPAKKVLSPVPSGAWTVEDGQVEAASEQQSQGPPREESVRCCGRQFPPNLHMFSEIKIITLQLGKAAAPTRKVK